MNSDNPNSLPPPQARTPDREEIRKWVDDFGIAQDFDTNDGVALIEAWINRAASAPQEAGTLTQQLIDMLQENIGGNCD